MKMRTLFIVNAVIQFFFGVGFMFAPTILLGLFGTQTDVTGITLAHVAGGVILSLAIISWLGKDVESGPAQDAIAWGGVFFAHAQAGIYIYPARHPERNFQRPSLVSRDNGCVICSCILLGARK